MIDNMENIDIYRLNEEGTSLRKHQKHMLDMLCFVDKISRENNIPYFLSGGTLLGAVRHKGFIPWDDDLDIVFLKKDLKRIHKILKSHLSDKYRLQANDTDANYMAPYEKLRLLNTEIKETNTNDKYYKYKGIYIDLFFLEPAIPSCHKISEYIQRVIMFFANKIPAKNLILKFLLRLIFLLSHKLFFPLLSFISSLLSKDMISYPLGSFFQTQFKKEWIFPLKEIEFENLKFYAPNNIDEVLKAQYGNYMEIPSKDKIKMHVLDVKYI